MLTSSWAVAQDDLGEAGGQQELAPGEEVVEEVFFAQEVERGSLDGYRAPEYDTRVWLWVLPVLCVLILAWNVRWSAASGKQTRRRT